MTRLRPARAMAVSFAGAARTALSGAVRELVWADLRDGVIRVGDLPRPVRGLVWLGFALLFSLLGVLFFDESLRASLPLLSMVGGTSGRGELVPSVLVPLTLFVVAVAWGFMLAGALHVRLTVRLAVLLLYLAVASLWTVGSSGGIFLSLLAWGALLGVPVFFAARWRSAADPALEFGVLLILVSLTFGTAQVSAVESWRISGVPGLLANLPATLFTLNFLIMPLLLFIGLDIAEFVHKTAKWASGLTDAWTNRPVLYGTLFLFLAYRLGSVTLETFERVGKSSLAGEAAAYAGALVIPLSVGIVWWLVGRPGGDRVSVEGLVETAKRAALPLIGAYMGLYAANIVLVLLAGLLGLLFLALGFGQVEGVTGALEFSGRLLAQDANWQTLLALVALLAAIRLAWRRRQALALYLGILGANGLWIQLTDPGRPLSLFGWSGLEPVDFWWVLFFSGVTVYWLARRRLTEARVRRLLALVAITFLMRQTGFIEDPFSPFLGFTGVGLVALGIVWDALTIGFWANNDSRNLPRVSRIFLYLGYVLFGVAVINWAVASHDILEVDFFTGQAALGGFGLLGKPLIYAIFAVTLALPATSDVKE
ncbi:MAG: hypothetical protein AB1425_03725 [Actinomycetota bacterium]